MRIVAMIPARLGSKRIPKKNLRLLAGEPLVCHVAKKAKQAGVFDEIYINSEAYVFRGIAKDLGVKFYKRDDKLAGDDALNDDFVLDFINKVSCDIVVQINPTSPLIKVEDIKNVVDLSKKHETVHSVKTEQIEMIFRGVPMNFDPMKKMPRSQELEPVFLFSSGIMAWQVKSYKKNMEKYGCATYGAGGDVAFYELGGFATCDIDWEEDFKLAEAVLQMKEVKKEYYK